MHIDNSDDITRAISRSSAMFRSLNADVHTVLFFDDYIFDYIVDTREVRPYNTGYWFQFKKDGKYKHILEYISDISEISYIDGDGHSGEFVYGFVSGNIVAININNLIKMLEGFVGYCSRSDCKNTNCDTTKITLAECVELKKLLEKKYDYWDL